MLFLVQTSYITKVGLFFVCSSHMCATDRTTNLHILLHRVVLMLPWWNVFFLIPAGYSEDSDYTSDVNFPVLNSQFPHAAASQYLTVANDLATPQQRSFESYDSQYFEQSQECPEQQQHPQPQSQAQSLPQPQPQPQPQSQSQPQQFQQPDMFGQQVRESKQWRHHFEALRHHNSPFPALHRVKYVPTMNPLLVWRNSTATDGTATSRKSERRIHWGRMESVLQVSTSAVECRTQDSGKKLIYDRSLSLFYHARLCSGEYLRETSKRLGFAFKEGLHCFESACTVHILFFCCIIIFLSLQIHSAKLLQALNSHRRANMVQSLP